MLLKKENQDQQLNGFNFFVCVNFTTNVVMAINNFKNTFYVQ